MPKRKSFHAWPHILQYDFIQVTVPMHAENCHYMFYLFFFHRTAHSLQGKKFWGESCICILWVKGRHCYKDRLHIGWGILKIIFKRIYTNLKWYLWTIWAFLLPFFYMYKPCYLSYPKLSQNSRFFIKVPDSLYLSEINLTNYILVHTLPVTSMFLSPCFVTDTSKYTDTLWNTLPGLWKP